MMRTARADELPLILDWATAEGWNPGLDDAAAFHAADPEGFFVAERNGAPVAAISVVNHDERNAFLGLYICYPGWRGHGIGHALWTHALAHAAGRSVGLDGVAAQQANYAKSGFVRHGATQRFVGTLVPKLNTRIRPVTLTDIPALIAFDHAVGGVHRPSFLTAWLTPTATRRAFMFDDGTGFAVIRVCREGTKIGPILALDAPAALALAQSAVAHLPAAATAIDLPEQNANLRDALIANGFTLGFETARMYRGPAPTTDTRLAAIATMELG